MTDDVSRRDLLLAILGLSSGYSVARVTKDDGTQDLVAAGGEVANGAVSQLITFERVVIGDDPGALLDSLNRFPQLMLDTRGGIRLLEEYETGTEVIELADSAQLIVADTLAQAKDKIDQYPALAIVRGEGATLIEQ